MGTAILGKKEGFDVFVSDAGKIKDSYKEVLMINGIKWEEESQFEVRFRWERVLRLQMQWV